MWLVLLILAGAWAQETRWNSELQEPEWREIFLEGGMQVIGPRNKRFIAQTESNLPPQECVLPNTKKGQCRPLRQCVQEDIKQDFFKFIEYLCVINGTAIGVCCPDVELRLGGPGGLAGELPATAPREEQNEAALKALRAENRGCGLSTRSASRVLGARPADPREWPWMARVTPEGFIQHCGGVLITDRHVLTAAHCTERFTPEELMVTLGEYDVDRDDETRTYNFQVIEKREHQEYDRSNYHHDISILKVNRPALFNTYVWPVCLPPMGMNLVNESVVVIGWGMQWYGGPASSVLLELTLPVWDRVECVKAFTEAVWEENICAGGEDGKDSCQGDSGGPLMYQLPSGRWAVVGVVSWGVGCGHGGRPGIYTSVDKYLPWIIENARF